MPRDIKIVLLACLAGTAIFLNGAQAPLYLDDGRALFLDPEIYDFQGWRSLLSNGRLPTRPFIQIMNLISFKIFGYHYVVWRIQQLIVHVASVMLLYLIIRRIAPEIAVLSAIIFAVHPLVTMPILYLHARADILFSFFVLLVLYLLQSRTEAPLKLSNTISILVFSCLAGLTSELAFIIPFLALIIFRPKSVASAFNIVWPAFPALLTQFILAGIISAPTHVRLIEDVIDRLPNYLTAHRVFLELISLLSGFGTYSIEHDFTQDLYWPATLIFAATMILGLICLFRNFKPVTTWGKMAPWISATTLIMMPMSTYLANMVELFEYRLYLLLAFCAPIGATFLYMILKYFTKPMREILIGTLIITLGISSMSYCKKWENPLRMYAHALDICPQKPRVYFVYAHELSHVGQKKAAFFMMLQGLEVTYALDDDRPLSKFHYGQKMVDRFYSMAQDAGELDRMRMFFAQNPVWDDRIEVEYVGDADSNSIKTN